MAEGANGTDGRVSVNYDGFIDDVSVGDILLVDGGLQSLKLKEKKGKDVLCEVLDGGTLTSRWGLFSFDWPCISLITARCASLIWAGLESLVLKEKKGRMLHRGIPFFRHGFLSFCLGIFWCRFSRQGRHLCWWVGM